MDPDRRPIGYWLKHLDGLIEGAFTRALAAERLSRRHWQVLNTLRAGAASEADLARALAPFLAGGAADGRGATADLIARGWVRVRDGGLLELTAAGEQVHAALLERVGATRALLTRGVTPQEYRAVIDVLRRMAANLEQAAAES